MSEPRLLVLCVNYNSDQDVLALAGDLFGQDQSGEILLLVADNTSRGAGDPGLVFPPEHRDRATVFATGTNLGYFGAAARALAFHREKHPLPEWVAVSNADLSLPGRDFLSRLSAAAPCAVLAPAIRSSITGADQNPFMRSRPSRSRMHFYKVVFGSKILTRAYLLLSSLKSGLKRLLRRRPAAPGQSRIPAGSGAQIIYAPHGSFILFHRSYFEAGGTLAHGAFLFGEEIFVGETARSLRLDVRYDPTLEIVHREHTTTRSVRNDVLFRYRKEAAKYCADAFF